MALTQSDLSALRDGKAESTIPFLDELQQRHSTVEIYKAILNAIDQQYLQPPTLYIFLKWSKSLEVIASCVPQRIVVQNPRARH